MGDWEIKLEKWFRIRRDLMGQAKEFELYVEGYR